LDAKKRRLASQGKSNPDVLIFLSAIWQNPLKSTHNQPTPKPLHPKKLTWLPVGTDPAGFGGEMSE